MTPILNTFANMLRNEASTGYQDTCVFGGFQSFLTAWKQQAASENIPPAFIDRISHWLQSYWGSSPSERAESLQELLRDIESGRIAAPAAHISAVLQPEGNGSFAAQASHPPENAPAAGTAQSPSEELPEKQESSQPISTRPNETTLMALRELQAPLTRLTGIGEKTEEGLHRLGLRTIGDLLWYLPRRYVDYSSLKPINRLLYGEIVTVIGEVMEVHTRRTRKMPVTEMLISDGSGSLLVTFYNQPWIENKLHAGQLLSLSGKISQYLGRLILPMPEWEYVDRQQVRTGGILPIYRLTAGINQNLLRKQIHNVLDRLSSRLPDPLPETILREGGWMPFGMALRQVHFPSSWESHHAAKDRLGFEELLYLQLGIQQQRRDWIATDAHAYPRPMEMDAWIAALPYPLTGAQQRAVGEIFHDLASGQPMSRLLEGDVGSGKTIVALAACLTVALQGGQAAFLAPTSILAEQHFQQVQALLAGEGKPLASDQVALLLGSTPESEKQILREGLASGKIALVVGTHALLEGPVEFAKLDLAIVDEQHRFGVDQRARLRAKGKSPHLLAMTATPIPRSLALTIYGDLDLSILDEMPPGRQPVTTRILLPGERERAYTFIAGQLKKGFQAFIICPRIEEDEGSEATAAVEEHKRLQEQIFPEWKLGLLHGRMRADEKDDVMHRFRAGELHLLVSTSVVEVGVDIPNATVMMVEGASRFGLAQLHQFRGRVGRSEHPSFCILAADNEDDAENERLRAMESVQDGFALAEKDLEQRGPGEFFGQRQSGFADSRLMRMLDLRLIEKARATAQEIFARDPDLSLPEHALIAERMVTRWQPGAGEVS
jgi:ATP-dependent DNA helicase RecG